MWPFLGTEAATLGVSSRRLRSPEYRPVLRGVFVDARVPDTIVTRSRAALLLAPDGAALSHWTAARLLGGRVPDNDFVHVSLRARARVRIGGVRPHHFTYPLDVVRRHGMPVTSPLQTFCHMARFLGLVDLVAFGDSLLRKGRVEARELVQYTKHWPGQFRAEAAMAARLVRPHVDSSPESALRLLMVLGGLPEPETDVQISDADGRLRFRIDLGYRDAKLAVEYDGRWHDEQRAHDESRRANLTETEGWRFVVVTADDLYDRPEQLLSLLAAELDAAGVLVPGRLSDAWRLHFRVSRVAA